MDPWLKISLLLCMFGFLKEIRPSEAYIFNFLTGPWRNVTADEVNEDVYPIGTYSYLALLVVAFLVTDLCRYKPFIVLCGLSGTIVWGMLLWTKSLFALQMLEVVYGLFMSTEIAYYTYIYAKVDKEHFQKVTSHTRAAILAGRSLSSILGQILVSFNLMNYRDLNYISFGALIFASVWAVTLPRVEKSIYFHQDGLKQTIKAKCKSAFHLMKSHFIQSFSHKHVIKWSLYYSLSTAGFIQVQVYMQPLWAEILGNSENLYYNGSIEASLTLLGFLSALAAGYLKIDWKIKGEIMVGFLSILQGGFLIWSSQAEEVTYAYVFYIVFGGLYHFMVTIASAEIAKYLTDDSYGLVFGFNMFIALGFQSLLTAVFVNRGGLTYTVGNVRNQFLTYGVYHLIIALIYLITGLIAFAIYKKKVNTEAISCSMTEINKY